VSLPFTCNHCGKPCRPLYFDDKVLPKGNCRECLDMARGYERGPDQSVRWTDKSSVLVFENPGTGQVSYPGRNDRPMPKKYADAGFRPKRMKHLHEVDALTRRTGAVNQAMHFDEHTLPPCDDR